MRVRGDLFLIFLCLAFVALALVLRYVFATEQSSKLALSLSLEYLVFTACSTVAYRLSPLHPLAKFPGPYLWSISSLFLVRVSFAGKRHHLIRNLHEKYGKFVRIGPDLLSINSMDAVPLLYGSTPYMDKSDAYTTPGQIHSVGLFFKQTQQAHEKRKKVWMTALSGSNVTELSSGLEGRILQLLRCIEIRQLREGKNYIDLGECLEHWSYDFMGEMVFGGCNNIELMRNGDPNNLVIGGKKAMVAMDSINQCPWLMDIVWHLPGGRDMVHLRDLAAEMLRNRIKMDGQAKVKDLCSFLVDTCDSKTGERISQPDLELDAVTAIHGGSDTVSGNLTVAFYFLLAEPKYYEALYKELSAAYDDPLGPLDTTTLSQLPMLNGTIDEALRLSTGFYFPRIVPEGGIVIQGQYIPEGMVVSVPSYTQQINPENFYPDPLAFRPERWTEGGLGPQTKTNKAALLSFSAGPHVCAGKAFAYQEMRYVIARLVLVFEMKLRDGFDVLAWRENMLHMRTTVLQPLPVVVSPRLGIEFFD
ncbi:cytochrome P450 [Fistulina hepatica ATCC 64428]|uniref:Cytochrome P450 n=1 Tax=Fistulina hepatica ATCC 64428 TaxID=1128425 RepID=A0A0D7AGK7_9AGAR|nr:cytochrome P450 [Fistulina hepatica ATCC 64428]